MKGIVFKEFINLVDSTFGEDAVENIIEKSDLKSQGAYTAVGTYDHKEMLSLVSNLSALTKTPISSLVKLFGEKLCLVFSIKFSDFFKVKDAYSFIKSIDDIIHVEVQKLYPDAELPKFSYKEEGNKLIVDYSSTRPFADLAEGLLIGVIKHYKESIKIETVDLSNGANTSRRFILEKNNI